MSENAGMLGVGFYSRASAARLLRVNPSTLNRWVSGYTYQTQSGKVRKEAVVSPSVPVLEGEVALSFVDLIELRVVKGLLDRGLSLQAVRRARDLAQEHFPVPHPFASRRVFTPAEGSRKSVFIESVENDVDADFLELTSTGYLQIQAGPIVEGFLEEIEFDEQTALADRWWPMGREVPVVLDPKVAFGAPVVQGTGVRTEIVSDMISRTSMSEAAVSFQLDLERARAALRFEELLRAA